jgi:uncharacterized membrane protein YkvI
MKPGATWFQRFVLPALAFKAVVIGGGYATGRELAEYFMPSGPRGGLFGMMLATLIWSLVCVVTFLFARLTKSADYSTFFRHLLGRAGVSFELAYFIFLVLLLAVFGAAAGAIGAAAFGVPELAGTLLLTLLIALFATFGNTAVEGLFKYVSIFLYATYAIFLVLCIGSFGHGIADAFAAPQAGGGGNWAVGGVTYAGYNVIGAVIILPVVRHMTSGRDAIVAGLLCGPLAMLPAALFFVCMAAFYPGIAQATLPSDVLLQKLHFPLFRLAFQTMIFAALLECGTGMVHAVNERLAQSWRARRNDAVPRALRLAVTLLLLIVSIFLAGRFGLVTLIARGYRVLAWVFLCVYVLPVLTFGLWRLTRAMPPVVAEAAS